MKILNPTIYFTKMTDKDGQQYIQASGTAVVLDYGNEMSVRVNYMTCSTIEEARNKFRVQLERICSNSTDNDSRVFEKYKWLEGVCNQCKAYELSNTKYWNRSFQKSFVENVEHEYEFQG